ncbi:hypothetical protein J1P26_21845 [Neobacillus sp. MM2021_6]|uniref:hypothetical protein n=1 Tax=Bacillaceae TaxID=186817 RepID=UPI001408D389|nr:MULTISPECIES: hypothetical protein [Bacillaceae]MBO0962350.1 hypothetical protein [Neobacillus sp. MM2021_6]NHC20833.1 hypothetical protein [Bacillus sp. MM2020_4]
MNRAQRRQANRLEKNGPNRLSDLPKYVQNHQQNMAAILVTSALTVLAEDFHFTPEQLNEFNEKLQMKAMSAIK